MEELKRQNLRASATEVFAALMLLVFPLFTGLAGYGAITLSKFVFFTAATVLWLGVLVWGTVKEKGKIKLNAAQMIAAAFMLLCCISAVFGGYFPASLFGSGRYDGLFTWLLYALIFMGVSAFGEYKEYYGLCFAVSVSVCCVVAILQLFGLDPLWLFPGDYCYYDAHIRFTGEFLGTIGNANLLSALLCLAIPLFFGLFTEGKGKRSAVYLIPMALSVNVLAASGVAGGALACCVTAPVMLCVLGRSARRLKRMLTAGAICCASAALAAAFRGEYSNGTVTTHFSFTLLCGACLAAALILGALALTVSAYREKISPRFVRRACLACALTAVAAAALTLWFFPGKSGTLYEMSQVMHGRFDDSFGSSRIRIWRRTLELWREKPVIGSGPGTLALRLDIVFSRFVEETGKTLTTYADNAHNVYLQLLSETGAAGLAAYIVLLAAALMKGLKHKNTHAAALAVFCYCVQSFFGLELCITAPVFWVFLGLLASDNIQTSTSGGINEG